MSQKLIGVAVRGNTVQEALGMIEHAESLGIHAAWMTTGGARPDNLTTFAAAAVRTQRIKLGTSIVPTFPRHPIVMVQQTQVVAQLAPGRFRLGVGPSHRPTMEAMGVHFTAPLWHLREYLRICKALLQTGRVDFDGTYYKAHEAIPEPLPVPVMASALQKGSFELCGEEADGAISWICPGPYLRDIGLPAMHAGAERAGRPVPPLIAHAPVCVHDNAGGVIGRQDIVQGEQFMIERWWLNHPDIDPGPGNLPVLQRFHQGVFIDDTTARCVDEERTGLHQRQFPPPDHVPGFRIQRTVDGEKIRLRQELGQRDGRCPAGLDVGSTKVGVTSQHPHLQAFATDACHPLAHLANANNAKRAPMGIAALNYLTIDPPLDAQ
jgi:hypothetical protein